MEKFTFQSPTNSISLLYGDGYDLCGSLAYTIMDKTGRRPHLTSNVRVISSGANMFDVVIYSEQEGIEVSLDLMLRVSLLSHKQALAAIVPLQVTYRECEVKEFLPPSIEDILLKTGQRAGEITELHFD